MTRLVSTYQSMSSQEAYNIELSRVVNLIKEGWWADKIKTLPKESLPCFTVSGTFVGAKKQENIDQKSLVASLDLDDVGDNQEQINQVLEKVQKNIYAQFKSTSGNGICVLVAIDDFESIEDYKEIYEALYDDLKDLNNFCKFDHLNNLNRLRYVSYDPDLYLNEQAVPYTKRKELLVSLPTKKDGVVSTVSLDLNKLSGTERIAKVVETYITHTGHFGANGKPRHDWVLGLARWLCRADVDEHDAFSYISTNFTNPDRGHVWTKEVSRCIRDSYNAYASERGSYVPTKKFNYNDTPHNVEQAKTLFLQYIGLEEENSSKITDQKLKQFVTDKINFLKTIYKHL